MEVNEVMYGSGAGAKQQDRPEWAIAHGSLDNMHSEIIERLKQYDSQIARLQAERESWISVLNRITPPVPQGISTPTNLVIGNSGNSWSYTGGKIGG